MGGYGSGRRNGFIKGLVEDCYRLPVSVLKKGIRYINNNEGSYHGTVSWTVNGVLEAAIDFQTKKKRNFVVIELKYKTISPYTNTSKDIDFPVRIQTTTPNYGGKRNWFTCPLLIGGVACEKRVGILYLPPGRDYFGCRHCYELTYLSSRESHIYDRLFGNLGVDSYMQKMFKSRF